MQSTSCIYSLQAIHCPGTKGMPGKIKSLMVSLLWKCIHGLLYSSGWSQRARAYKALWELAPVYASHLFSLESTVQLGEAVSLTHHPQSLQPECSSRPSFSWRTTWPTSHFPLGVWTSYSVRTHPLMCLWQQSSSLWLLAHSKPPHLNCQHPSGRTKPVWSSTSPASFNSTQKQTVNRCITKWTDNEGMSESASLERKSHPVSFWGDVYFFEGIMSLKGTKRSFFDALGVWVTASGLWLSRGNCKPVAHPSTERAHKGCQSGCLNSESPSKCQELRYKNKA